MSGAEETIDEFLKHLKHKKFDVLSINCNEKHLLYNNMYDEVIADKSYIIQDEFNKIFFTCYDNFFNKVKEIIIKFKPDIMLCQLNGLPEVVEISKMYDIPVIYFMHSYFYEDSRTSNNYNTDLLCKEVKKIVCLSHFIKNSLPNCLKEKAEVVYPYIDPIKFKCRCEERNTKSILFFNPIRIKGVEIVIELAKRFPTEVFEVYENWERVNDKYRLEFEMLSNVVLKKKTTESKILYANAKIFLMPSLCKEGFGRGIVEANINSIPAICSNIGGIKEALGENQIVIDDYFNIDTWEKFLRQLLEDKVYYDNLAEVAKIKAEEFNQCNIEKVILDCI